MLGCFRFFMSTLLQDTRLALRAFLKNPGFTVTAVLSLAIGIGANTSIFSVADALLLRPLPYKDAVRLVMLWNRSPGLGITQDWFSTAQYLDVKSGHQGFEEVAIASGSKDTLTGEGEPERIGTIRASSNLLPMLGAEAFMGRLFRADEDQEGRPAAAVLTHGMWMRRYGGIPQVLGKLLTINDKAYEVVGVLPEAFVLPHEVLPTLYGPDQPDVFLPFPLSSKAGGVRTGEDYNIVGKLKRGVTIPQAQAEMDALTARLRRDYPESYPPNGGLTFGIVPLLEQVVGDVRRSLVVLLSAVGFVLLIACANVANLLLSRAVARQQEMAVRTSLGAGRARIVRQLLTESVLLGLIGGALGALFSIWNLKWIHVLGTKSIPRLASIGLDWRVLLFTLVISLLSGVLFGLAPALRISRLDLNSALKDASRGSAGASAVWGRGNNLRRLLVVSELALSVVLLIGAGLLIRSYSRLQNVAPGFNPKNVLTFDLALSGHRYDDKQARLNAFNELWRRCAEIPGVTASGSITALPLSAAFAWTPITIEGRTPLPGEKFLNADARVVGGKYFQAMEIPLRAGRFFNEDDVAGKMPAVLIDEFMAQQLWPGQSAVGKRMRMVESQVPWFTIVGVVGRVKHESLDSDPRIAFYLPQTQYPGREMTVVLRGAAEAGALSSAVKQQLRGIDSDLPMYAVQTMTDRVDESLARRRFSMLLLGLFAAFALALATVGIYGVMAYLVNQGRREIGIRLALGATQKAILQLVVAQGMTLAIGGVAIGLAAALIFSRMMRSLLFGVSAADPLTFCAIAALLALVALLATYIPARRAARVDPIQCLRSE
jgi:predicted permease